MAGFFTFDFAALVSKDKLKAATCKALDSDTVEVVRYDVSKASEEIEGFLSIMLRVKVNFVYKGDQFSKMFIIKRMPIVPIQVQMVKAINAFEKEIRIFTEIVEEYKLLLEHTKVRSLPLPKCYFTEVDGTNDILIMEDLKDSDFKLGDKIKGLDLDHCLLVMKSLSKFHALSVILEQKLNSPLLEVYPFLGEFLWMAEGESVFQSFLKRSLDGLLACIQTVPQYLSFVPALSARFDGLWVESSELNKFSKNTLNVLCHGDCHVNNMMFHYEKRIDKEIPDEVKFVDFQASRYAPPATDIIYFLYTSTEPNLRRQHTKTILEMYHKSFVSMFLEMGVSEPSFSLEELLKTYEERKPLGVLMSCWFRMSLYFGEVEKLPKDLNEVGPEVLEELIEGDFSDKLRKAFSENENFRQKTLDIIEDTLEVLGLK